MVKGDKKINETEECTFKQSRVFGQLIFQKAVMEIQRRNNALFQQMALKELGIHNNNKT